MVEAAAPVDLFYWLLAVIPIVALLVLLIGLSWEATEAGPVGMFLAGAIALLAFRTPLETLAVAGGKGVWDAIFILYVVWPALILYHVIRRAGGFTALQEGIQRFSDNQLFLVLAFGWVFASFLQGIAGFGTPIAVVAPLLLAIDVRPVYAVAIPLIGHAWANMFGTLAVGWLATLQVVELQAVTETAVQTAIMLWIPALLAGFAIAWMYGRWQGVKHAWPFVLIIGTIQGGGQLALMLWDPVLSTFIASTAALIALYPLSTWDRYSDPIEDIDETPAMEDDAADESDDAAAAADCGRTSKNGGRALADGGHPEDDGAGGGNDENAGTAGDEGDEAEDGSEDEQQVDDEEQPEPVMGFGMSLLPYVVLTIAATGGLVIPSIEAALGQFEVGLPFPSVETGYGLEIEAEEPYSPFAPLSHPGTFLLVSVIVGWAVYRVRGYYDQWDERKEEVDGVWEGLSDDAIAASLAIVAFLVMAKVMDHSGQIEVLAIGIATIAPPMAFAFFSSWIGTLGAFMTSSNTSSNILFAPLQQQSVAALDGLSEPTIIGAQSAGGAIGNAIAPANVVLGTGAVGILGEEGAVLRKTIPWAFLLLVIVGFTTVLLNGLTFIGGG